MNSTESAIPRINLSDVVYREDLYPRLKSNPTLVQRYAADIDVLPPIEINQNNILIDGWHRWTAHRKINAETIKVVVTETASEIELFALAIQRNASHGEQLDEESKKMDAIRLYASGTGLSKERIAEVLSVSDRTVRDYLSDEDKKLAEQRDRLIFNMWMSCYTQEEIQESSGIPRKTISDKVQTFGENGSTSVFAKSLSFERDNDFVPPLYNIWTFAKKTNAVSHFGNSEQRIVDNLLYLYTEPFDIVVDPFAGGGSTIDVCKRRLRRYWASDRKPIV